MTTVKHCASCGDHFFDDANDFCPRCDVIASGTIAGVDRKAQEALLAHRLERQKTLKAAALCDRCGSLGHVSTRQSRASAPPVISGRTHRIAAPAGHHCRVALDMETCAGRPCHPVPFDEGLEMLPEAPLEPRLCTHPPGCTFCNWCGLGVNAPAAAAAAPATPCATCSGIHSDPPCPGTDRAPASDEYVGPRMIVHFLRGGQTPCHMRGLPATWPPGHLWAHAWKGVTCEECRLFGSLEMTGPLGVEQEEATAAALALSVVRKASQYAGDDAAPLLLRIDILEELLQRGARGEALTVEVVRQAMIERLLLLAGIVLGLSRSGLPGLLVHLAELEASGQTEIGRVPIAELRRFGEGLEPVTKVATRLSRIVAGLEPAPVEEPPAADA